MKNLILILMLVLTGCQTILIKDGASQADFQKEKMECEYEATKYVQTPGVGYQTAFGSELDMAMRRKDLILQCMQLKGWRKK